MVLKFLPTAWGCFVRMGGVPPSRGTVRFGSFEVDPHIPELRKRGFYLSLPCQALHLLLLLLERPGELVTRNEIRQEIWPADVYVDFEHGVNNAVNRLRAALGDSAKQCRYIETVPKRGYRFVAVVERTPRLNPSIVARYADEQARELYLKGRYCWNRRTPETLLTALSYFQQAIERDPNYAQAYAGLADSYALLGAWTYESLPPREAYPRAKAAALKALELDYTLAEAHVSLAMCLAAFDWNYAEAAEQYRQANELNPDYATGHHWYALQLADLGRYDEAIVEIKRAERLAPLSPVIGADTAQILLGARLFDESLAQSGRVLEFDPTFAVAHFGLGQAYLQKEMYGEAMDAVKRAIELSGRNPKFTSTLGYTFGVAGKKEEAAKILSQFEHRSKQGFSHFTNLASIYAGLDDNNQAIAWLEKAYEQRFDPEVLHWPTFDNIRRDVRFRNLMRRVGLPT